jgi:hypothetical protein
MGAAFQAGINHAGDAGNGQRGLRHIGGQNHPLVVPGGQRPALFCPWHRGVQSDALGINTGQGVMGGPNSATPGQEHENVTIGLFQRLAHRRGDAIGQLFAVGHVP